MHALEDLRDSDIKATRDLFRLLHPKSPFPKDLMDLKPLNDLLKPALFNALKAEGTLFFSFFLFFVFYVSFISFRYFLRKSRSPETWRLPANDAFISASNIR